MAQNGNINLSTLLLLGVLLFLIYCLMQQRSTPSTKERIDNTPETNNNQEYDAENFEDLPTEEFEDATEVSTVSSESSETASFENTDDDNVNNNNNADDSVYNRNADDSVYNRNVEDVTIDHFTPPADRDFTSPAPKVPKGSKELMVKPNTKSDGPVNSTLLNNASSIFTFEPSDNSTHSGASLNNAFERPVPASADTDVVDLNKNNVTNYNATDYLPKEINDDWFNTDFSQAKYKMNDDKLINTDKYVVGVNTVGQSLKNASYDIRGAINVPKYTVSPWNNSTIEPDYNIKPLC
jgi:hypothetical protein